MQAGRNMVMCRHRRLHAIHVQQAAAQRLNAVPGNAGVFLERLLEADATNQPLASLGDFAA